MPSTLNSDNGAVSGSAGLKSSADSSGVLALQTNGTTAVTISTGQVATFAQAPVLPAASIPQAALASGVAGNGPAFSAYTGASQTVTASTYTKVACNTEEFDTNSNFDSATNYRFTPTVAGYYQVTGQISYVSSVLTRAIIVIYKNGSAFKFGNDASVQVNSLNVTALVYFNGSTDYVELYGWMSGTGTLSFQATTSTNSYFQAAMVRSA